MSAAPITAATSAAAAAPQPITKLNLSTDQKVLAVIKHVPFAVLHRYFKPESLDQEFTQWPLNDEGVNIRERSSVVPNPYGNQVWYAYVSIYVLKDNVRLKFFVTFNKTRELTFVFQDKKLINCPDSTSPIKLMDTWLTENEAAK